MPQTVALTNERRRKRAGKWSRGHWRKWANLLGYVMPKCYAENDSRGHCKANDEGGIKLPLVIQ